MEINENKLIVKQKVDLVETFLPIEVKNRYEIFNETGNKLFIANEESNLFSRFFLKDKRPLTIEFKELNSEDNFLKIKKNFAFFLPKFEIFKGEELLCTIVTKLGVMTKIEILNKDNSLKFFCSNSIGHPWTFKLTKNKDSNEELAIISKEWSGLGKEFFSDADNFLVNFLNISDMDDKLILLALGIIVDLYIFENK